MAGVPNYENFRVSPRGDAGFPFSVPSTEGFDEPARQVARAARGASQAGEVLHDIAIREQDQANQTRVMEAANQVRETALRLAYDPNEGYTRVRGGDVLPRDGKPLAIDYTDKFDEQVNSIGEGLTNDEQRRLFAAQAMQLRTSFESGAMEHEAREWSGYELSVAEGARQLAIEEIAQAHNNPAAIDLALGSLGTAVNRLGELKGLSGNEITAMVGANVSAAIRQSIASALSANDLTTAQGLFERYGDHLVEADEIAIKGVIEKELDGQLVMQAADVADGIGPMIEGPVPGVPEDVTFADPLRGAGGDPIPGGRYGAHRDYGAHQGADFTGNEGLPVRSGAGGGVVHVSHSPNGGNIVTIDHGNGVKTKYMHLSRVNVRDGQTVTDATIIGNVGHTGRASGPHLHYEVWVNGNHVDPTRLAGSSRAGNGQAPQRTVRAATLDEMWAVARAHLMRTRPDASPELIRATRAEVEARWSMHERSRAAQEDQTMQQVYAELVRNGGSYTALPQALRQAIPADQVPHAMEFARSLQTNTERAESDPATYLRLTDPATLAAMSDSEFMRLKPLLTDSDFRQFATDRGNERQARDKGRATAARQAQALPREAVNRIVNNRINGMGLTNAEDVTHIAAIRMFVDRAVLGEQGRLGRQMRDSEITTFVDQLFATSVPTHRRVAGLNLGPTDGAPLLSIDAIPSGDLARLKQSFARAGNPNPSEADLLAAWYRARSN